MYGEGHFSLRIHFIPQPSLDRIPLSDICQTRQTSDKWQRFCPALCRGFPKRCRSKQPATSTRLWLCFHETVDPYTRIIPGLTPDYQRIAEEILLLPAKRDISGEASKPRETQLTRQLESFVGKLCRSLRTFQRKCWNGHSQPK